MNKIMHKLYLFCLLIFISISTFAELPDDSVYHLESAWVDQNENKIQITELKDNIQIVAFIYSYCGHSCPVIMAKLKDIAQQIPKAQRDNIHFSLFSLDPKRDTPETLKAFAKKHSLDETRWSLFNGDPDDVLELAAALGVRYKPMNNDNDDIAHSNMITILDTKGRLHYQSKNLGHSISLILDSLKKPKS